MNRMSGVGESTRLHSHLTSESCANEHLRSQAVDLQCSFAVRIIAAVIREVHHHVFAVQTGIGQVKEGEDTPTTCKHR